jgi:2-polyprenyl-3-methyl-5-hydroxy-6-metoxy-1,4-benzoquinol methylase
MTMEFSASPQQGSQGSSVLDSLENLREMKTFEYSTEFRELIIRLLRGMECWPHYHGYIEAHLGGNQGRIMAFQRKLCPEIEYHCGPLSERRVLDFGCGTGSTTAALAYYCKRVCAYDIDQESMEICKKRISEHGLQERIEWCLEGNLKTLKQDVGRFDVILMNGVLEHIPISKPGLRREIVTTLFDLLNVGGYLFITETPNRLYPFDVHTTQLWLIPWTRPGSSWAFRRAVRKGRWSETPKISNGPLGMEEGGAWGDTYWGILDYLSSKSYQCVNLMQGHDRRIAYTYGSWKHRAFESVIYPLAPKLFKTPLTAFAPMLTNLVFKKVAV